MEEEIKENLLEKITAGNVVSVTTRLVDGRYSDEVFIAGEMSDEHRGMYIQIAKGSNRSMMAHLKKKDATTIYLC